MRDLADSPILFEGKIVRGADVSMAALSRKVIVTSSRVFRERDHCGRAPRVRRHEDMPTSGTRATQAQMPIQCRDKSAFIYSVLSPPANPEGCVQSGSELISLATIPYSRISTPPSPSSKSDVAVLRRIGRRRILGRTLPPPSPPQTPAEILLLRPPKQPQIRPGRYELHQKGRKCDCVIIHRPPTLPKGGGVWSRW